MLRELLKQELLTAHSRFKGSVPFGLVLRMAFILDSFNGLFKLLFGCDLPDHEFLKHNQEEYLRKLWEMTKPHGNLSNFFTFSFPTPALFVGGQIIMQDPDLCGSLNLDPVTQREPR